MISRVHIMMVGLVAAVATLGSIGCSNEPGAGSQWVGQRCVDDDTCADELICVERRCRYRVFDQSDAGSDAVNLRDARADDAAVIDTDPTCEPGESHCTGDTTAQICADDGSGFDVLECTDGQYCDDGECLFPPE